MLVTSFLAIVTYAAGAAKVHAALLTSLLTTLANVYNLVVRLKLSNAPPPVCKVQTTEGTVRPTGRRRSRCGSRLHEWRLG